jgi:hypothetical protein
MISFTKSKRVPLSESEKVPGPGHYTTRKELGDGVPKVRDLIKLVYNEDKTCHRKR